MIKLIQKEQEFYRFNIKEFGKSTSDYSAHFKLF